jgi:signal transduction histidine kinase
LISTQTFYSIFLLLSCGLLVQFAPPYGRVFLKLSGPYWRASLSFLALSALAFWLSPNMPAPFLTLANGAYVASTFMLVVMVINTRRPLQQHEVWWWFFAGMALWVFVFELLRQAGAVTYVWRVCMVAGSIAIAFGMVTLITYRRIGSEKTPQFSIAIGCGLICVFALLLRAWVTWSSETAVLSIYDEPAVTATIRTVASVFHFTMFLMINNSFTTTLTTIKDLENRELVTGLETANKAAETGALSAAIAHELNQPLGAMRLNLQLLQDILPQQDAAKPQAKEIVRDLIHDIDRASNIITGLRRIFSKEAVRFENLDFNQLIESVCEIVGLSAKRAGIAITLDLVPGVMVALHPNEFQQVILNLINNAVNALNGLEKPRREIMVQTRVHGNKLQLSVADNGPGIDAALKGRIFDIFKTNRPEGMGLGLWLSKHIVERNNGSLRCENLPAGGARFIVELPVCRR